MYFKKINLLIIVLTFSASFAMPDQGSSRKVHKRHKEKRTKKVLAIGAVVAAVGAATLCATWGGKGRDAPKISENPSRPSYSGAVTSAEKLRKLVKSFDPKYATRVQEAVKQNTLNTMDEDYQATLLGTELMCAWNEGTVPRIALLLESKANPRTCTTEGETAQELALEHEENATRTLILKMLSSPSEIKFEDIELQAMLAQKKYDAERLEQLNRDIRHFQAGMTLAAVLDSDTLSDTAQRDAKIQELFAHAVRKKSGYSAIMDAKSGYSAIMRALEKEAEYAVLIQGIAQQYSKEHAAYLEDKKAEEDTKNERLSSPHSLDPESKYDVEVASERYLETARKAAEHRKVYLKQIEDSLQAVLAGKVDFSAVCPPNAQGDRKDSKAEISPKELIHDLTQHGKFKFLWRTVEAMLRSTECGEYAAVVPLFKTKKPEVKRCIPCGQDEEKEKKLRDNIDKNDVKAVEQLLEEGINPDCGPAESQTPLMCAARRGHPMIAELLLKYGADALQEREGSTVLTVLDRLANAPEVYEGCEELRMPIQFNTILTPYLLTAIRDKVNKEKENATV